MRASRHIRGGALLLAIVLAAAGAPAQDTPTDTIPFAADDVGLTSPRSTMRGFLTAARKGDWKTAASHLDLRNVPKSRREKLGPALAEALKTVLDRALLIDLEALSPSPSGIGDDGQPENRDVLGTIETTEGPVRLYVERGRDADGGFVWRVSRLTVSKIERLHEEFGTEPIMTRWLPSVFFDVSVFDAALWQWAGILVLAVAASLAALLVATILIGVGRLLARRTAVHVDDTVIEMAVGPVRLLLGAGVFSGGLHALRLPVLVHQMFAGLATGAIAVALTWFTIRLVTVTAQQIQRRMAAQGDRVGVSAVPLIRRVVNAVIVLIAVLIVIGSLGVNITGIVAGLGVGGLAVALAAQKSLENLFGGITLIVDQPVHVGDFCRFGDRIGTIEDIGLRSTRIRTLDRTVVTVPNAEFATMQIENFARRDRIWLQTTIGVRYETSPDQLRHLLIELKKLLVGHPKIDPDPARVRFAAFGAFSLDVEIFAYVRTTDFNEFLAVREDLFLRIMDIVAASGTGFAFPSQTIYTARDDGLDAERTAQAERAVADWRAHGRLFLPTIPETEAAELSDRLAYPPEGAAHGPARQRRTPPDD